MADAWGENNWGEGFWANKARSRYRLLGYRLQQH